MRNPKRIENLLDKLKELWLSAPDLRFGQLIFILKQKSKIDMFEIEDDEWLEIIKNFIINYQNKDKSGEIH